MDRPKLIAVLGPTASGKTDLAIDLAKEFDGEIINCDSRQVYREVMIGAAVEPGEWREYRQGGRVVRRAWVAGGVPHYLINFLAPQKMMSVAEFKAKAVWRAREIVRRGKTPFLVGGTGLYASAVIDNFQLPEVPPDERFRRRMLRRPTEELMRELEGKDPEYAARITPNPRYIVRALEVMRATGQKFSELQSRGEPLFDVLQLGVARSREETYERINRRFDTMVHGGLLDEASRLGRRYGWDSPAASSLGHRQLGYYLRGKMTLSSAVQEAQKATRNYAKRQFTWFRRDKRINWVNSLSEAKKLAKKHLSE